MATEVTSTKTKPPTADDRAAKTAQLEPAVHRRILRFLNEAVRPEDLVYERHPLPNPELDAIHEDNPDELKPKRTTILDRDIAERVIEFRDREYPLGFRNLK